MPARQEAQWVVGGDNPCVNMLSVSNIFNKIFTQSAGEESSEDTQLLTLSLHSDLRERWCEYLENDAAENKATRQNNT